MTDNATYELEDHIELLRTKVSEFILPFIKGTLH